jgi:hypothetical protein
MTTMLSLIQQATGEMGLPVPTYVAGNPAQDQIQQLALLNAVGYELAREYDWQAMCKEYRFSSSYTATTGNTTNGSAVITSIPSTTGIDSTYMVVGTGVPTDTYIQSVDSGTQVTMSQACTATGTAVTLNFCKTKYSNPSDFDRPIDRTQWDKTKHWEMLGPESPQQWQWLKSGYISTGPRMRFRRMGGYFQIWPPISSAEYLGMEYVSTQWAATSGGAGQTSLLADTDTCIFPDRLMVLGLMDKYFQVKGFGPIYSDQFAAQKSIAKANDGGSAILSFAPQVNQVLIGIANVPDTGYGT